MNTISQPLLSVSSHLSAERLADLRAVLSQVLRGAFQGSAEHYRLTSIAGTDTEPTLLSIESADTALPCNATEVAARLAETALLLIQSACRDLGVPVRNLTCPRHPALHVTGLSSYHVRRRLARLLSTTGSQEWVDLANPHNGTRLRVAFGRPFGSAGGVVKRHADLTP